MAGKPSYKKKSGDHKDFADKNTMNPQRGSKKTGSQTNGDFEQDVERRSGQYEGMGQAPLMKK
jgi:hypothetical protein